MMMKVISILICLGAGATGLYFQKVPAKDQAPVPAVKAPTPTLALPCQVIKVHDGDTVTVTATVTMNVRLIDCWAPEITGIQKPQGIKSQNNLQNLALGRKGILQVPLGGENMSISDVTTLGRVLGYVWVNDVNMSVAQVQGGFAATTKEESEKLFGPSK